MFRIQFKICSVALVAALICSTNVYSQINSITHSNNSNSTTIGIGPSESIVFFAGGDGVYDTLDFSVPVISAFGGVSPPPTIANISGLGIFSGASTVFTPANLSASSNAEVLLSLPNSTALAGGSPIAEVFFDTTGLSDGDIITYGPEGSFFNAGEEFETVNVLTFFATVQAVPEPSSAGLLFALASIVMLQRKRV